MRINDRVLTNVLVMHSEPLIELGMVAALSDQPGLSVRAASVALAGVTAGETTFNVLVADYQAALDFVAQKDRDELPRRLSDARTIVLATQHREAEVRMALERGVYGYLLTNCTVPELVDSIYAVHRGNRYLCPKVAQCVADSLAREVLTARELDVLCLLARGECNKAIAREIGVALGTVKAHMKAILQKLGAQSRTQALSLAVQRGLVPASLQPQAGRRIAGTTTDSARHFLSPSSG